jgi:opacity protein-like surface antigen
MKKTILISLLFLLSNTVLFAQLKTEKLPEKISEKVPPQYKPYFFGIDALLQTSQSKIEGSANITAVQKQFMNVGMYAGKHFGKHKFDVGFILGNSNNSWRYTNTRLNATVNPSLNLTTLNVRGAYNYQILTINDRFNIDIGLGITWIRLLTKQNLTYNQTAFDKLISTQTEKILQIKAYGIDGKIQFNYALNRHIQAHVFGQYRYAPAYLRAASATYFDAITGIKQDAAIISSAQTAVLLGMGLQYNLQPLFKEKIQKRKEKTQ